MANDVTIHVKAEDRTDMNVIGRKVEAKAKASFAKTGGHAGAAFAAGFIKTITFGMVGSGFAQSATRLMPSMAHFGGVLGAGLAAGLVMKAAAAVSALLPLALGAVIAAGPVMYLVKSMTAAEQKAKQAATRVDALRKQYANASSKDVRKRISEELQFQEMQEKMFRDRAHSWLELKKTAGQFMATISKPMEKPLERVFKNIGARMKDLAPDIAKMVKAIGPAFEKFAGGALGAISNFILSIKKHMPAIVEGFKEWGKQLPKIGKKIGDAIGKFLEDPEKTVQGVKDLAKAFGDLAGDVGDAFRAIKKFNDAYNKFADFVDKHEDKSTTSVLGVKMAEGIRKAWPKVKAAYNWFNNHLNKALDNIVQEHQHPVQAIRRAMSSIASAVRSGASRALSGLRSFASGARSRFNSVVAAARYGVSGIRSMMSNMASAIRNGASRAISVLRSLAARIRGAFAGAGHWLVGAGRAIVNGLAAGIRGAAGSVTGAVGGVVSRAIAFGKGLIHRASGGNVGAHAAEGGARGGQVLVGEQGPEIVDLPYGSHVNSNADSRRIASQQSGGGGRDVHIHFHNSVVAGASDLQRMLSDMKRRGQLDVILR